MDIFSSSRVAGVFFFLTGGQSSERRWGQREWWASRYWTSLSNAGSVAAVDRKELCEG